MWLNKGKLYSINIRGFNFVSKYCKILKKHCGFCIFKKYNCIHAPSPNYDSLSVEIILTAENINIFLQKLSVLQDTSTHQNVSLKEMIFMFLFTT